MTEKKWKKLYGHTISFVCPYCLKIIPVKDATLEHEPPQSRQEELGTSNIYLACADCNNEKGALTAEEYRIWKHLEIIRHGGKIK